MVDARTIDAMGEALDDEYKARATYRAIIDRFGPIRPFVNIIEAEDRHVRALLALYETFGVTPPPDRWAGQVDAPASIEVACADGVAAEIENREMYERLLRMTGEPTVIDIFRRLQSASSDNHLPAFERCLARHRRGGGRGRGG